MVETNLIAALALPRFWQQDHECGACTACGQTFSLLLRRHHCRICGFIFCSSCSGTELTGPENGYPGQERIRTCLNCFAFAHNSKLNALKYLSHPLLQTLPEWIESDIKSLENDLNPNMKLFIDSMDAYGNKHAHRLSSFPNISVKPLPSNKQFLHDLYNGHLRHILQQLLIRHGHDDKTWTDIIFRFAIKCSWQLRPCNSEMDLSSMIHVIGITEGAPSDSFILDGIALTNLNVVHRKMRTEIHNPKVLLLDCNFRQQHQHNMTSLKSLLNFSNNENHSQSYIDKILSLSPDVVITRDAIALETARIFTTHGISAISGVSEQELSMLQRCLDVPIFSAIALMNPLLDLTKIWRQCVSFSIERLQLPCSSRYAVSDKSSIYMKLALPEESSSFLTLILNGIGSIDQLTMLKSIIHAAVMSAWNLTLEASYIFDSSASFIPETFEKSPSISPVDDKGVASVSDVPFGPLSSSPLVVVHTPSIERRSIITDKKDTTGLFPNQASPSWLPTDQLLTWSLDIGLYWLHKESAAGQKHVPCFRPQFISTMFYDKTDTTLGEFLRETCFNAGRQCTCGRNILHHRCCIVHGNGKLAIEVDLLPQTLLQSTSSGVDQNQIMTWLWCAHCRRRSSPVVAMTSRALRLSLTKFFEICLYDYRARSRHESCGHRIHRDMIRCFGMANLIATVEYSFATPYEVSMSPRMLNSSQPNRRIAHLELLRIVSLCDSSLAIAARYSSRNTPSIVIDSASDVWRNKIRKDYNMIRTTASDIVKDGAGPTRTYQLYLTLFKLMEAWKAQLQFECKHFVQPSVTNSFPNPIALRWFLGDRPMPALIKTGIWNVPPTFGGCIIPIIPSQASTVIAHALASLQHAAFILEKPSASGIPQELKDAPIEQVLKCSLLAVNGQNEMAACQDVLRSVQQSIIPSRLSVTVDCADSGRCNIHFARQFQALRQCLCGSNFDVIESLTKSRRWAAKGGKSNATFIRTFDGRLVLKQISATEAKTFGIIASEYFRYVADQIFCDKPSVLVPILGLYELVHGLSTSTFFTLMPNLFCDPTIEHVFDLKGKSSGRLVLEHPVSQKHTQSNFFRETHDWIDISSEEFTSARRNSNGQVLQDENLALFTRGDPLPILSFFSDALSSAFENDANFLACLGIMDYSILLGIRELPPKKLTVGIIDYIRYYSLDKKVETTLKSLLTKESPTILPPVLYMQRFIDSMHMNFISTPNRERSSKQMPIDALDVDPEEVFRDQSRLTSDLPDTSDSRSSFIAARDLFLFSDRQKYKC